jgi:hypothetical protein
MIPTTFEFDRLGCLSWYVGHSEVRGDLWLNAGAIQSIFNAVGASSARRAVPASQTSV